MKGRSPFALSVQQHLTKHHGQQIFLGVFDGHGAEDCSIAHYARNNIAAVSYGQLLVYQPLHILSLTHTKCALTGKARLKKARSDTLKKAFFQAERALTESGSKIDQIFSEATAIVSWLFGRKVRTAWTGNSRCEIRPLASSENRRAQF